MWYYDYIVPSFLVLLIFQFYYLARPRLPIRINRTFQQIIHVGFAGVFTAGEQPHGAWFSVLP